MQLLVCSGAMYAGLRDDATRRATEAQVACQLCTQHGIVCIRDCMVTEPVALLALPHSRFGLLCNGTKLHVLLCVQ